MKNSKVIIVLVSILLLHGLVLGLVLSNGCSSTKAKTKPDVENKETAQTPSAPTTQELRQQALETIRKPYDYDNASSGSIPKVKALPGKSGIVVDLETRRVLWSKNANKVAPIASMTKLMTMLVAYEMVEDPSNSYSLETPVKVSRAAYAIGGSQVYLDPKETFTVEELMKAAAIKSANDAAYLLAEFFGEGDVNTFVRKMNAKAAELGMKHTKFRNPHGLPGKSAAEDNVSTPEDMVRLAEATLLHPKLMEWTSTWRANFRKPGTKGHMVMQNTNHLLSNGSDPCPGVDGLKTGFIQRSGYCLTATCKRGGRRVIVVSMGHNTWRERDRFVKGLLNWSYTRIDKE
ncbi:MAG: D-alanyl-D-alanine carboxypeptidase [Lentisphaerae bacterium]|nr:D-alanyl-D-alanine carboxypeptidase [Lentisphaerota bacterium]